MQNVTESEDCLFLNIWVRKTSFDSGKKVPVMFWIHGGAFVEGSASQTRFNGTMMAAYEDIIYVSVQYRLGPLGFLYMDEKLVTGNMGLWDQVEALKWISENILAFGGDPERITVSGQSAGAASVSLLTLSPVTSPYISQAIFQSGSALSSFATTTKQQALKRTEKVFGQLAIRYPKKCGRALSESQNPTDEDKYACLQEADAGFLTSILQYLAIEIAEGFSSGVIDNIAFCPIIDGNLIVDDPLKTITEGSFKPVPVLTGATKDEGTMFFQYSIPVI